MRETIPPPEDPNWDFASDRPCSRCGVKAVVVYEYAYDDEDHKVACLKSRGGCGHVYFVDGADG